MALHRLSRHGRFLRLAISTQGRRDAFASPTSDRCGCVCESSTPNLCTIGGSPQCISVRSRDPNNCVSCGATCPHGTHCAGDHRAYSVNHCGNMCLNFLTHPRNYGGCGNVCDSGYCWQGQCYNLPPDVCVPVDGFMNGGFGMHNSIL